MRERSSRALELRSLAGPIAELIASLRAAEDESAEVLDAVDAAHRPSARNLVHYLALRQHDLRGLQDRLAGVGLSSLGRAESCVMSTLAAVHELLVGGAATAAPDELHALDGGRTRLAATTELLFGPARAARRARILVTLPSAAADDPALTHALVAEGMDAARINCAHDDAAAWTRMIAHVRRDARAADAPCRILMDLPGPKLRTGALVAGPRVVKLRPTRDPLGRVVAPARAWLGAAHDAHAPAIPVERAWLSQLRPGDEVRLEDARGARRALIVVDVTATGALVETDKTAYLRTGARLHHRRGEAVIGELPPVAQPLVLRPGDALIVTRDQRPGHAGPPARIPCTLAQVFADVRPGDRIWFDDGAIGGRITEATPDELTVAITDARPGGSKLHAGRGINLPDTNLRLPPISDDDAAHLAFVAAHADLVGYSFVRRPSDVVELHARLEALGRPDLGVVLKIETREAFENLPALLLAAMRRPVVGVMIARGDLAVECGWERLAELQEEILWICEAAHVPVIWATQVLEQLTKEGRPSRAEITDAAMAARAECVMLNKGAHVVEAVAALDDILRRMEAHQTKKRAMLRRLALADLFAESRRPDAAATRPAADQPAG